MSYPYQPFYCEENAYRLLSETPIDTRDPHLLFISNASGQVLMLEQAAGVPPSGSVIWDYHAAVLTAEDMEVWDLDCQAGFPLPLEEYLRVSFGSPELAPADWQPQFRLISQKAAKANFSTDRSHMRDEAGGYLKPPPPWSPPQNGPPSFLSIISHEIVDTAKPHLQPWLSRDELTRWAASRSATSSR